MIMKKKVFCLSLLLSAFFCNASAQVATKGNEKMSEQQRVEVMTKIIEDKLMLDESESKKFATLYRKYLADIAKATPEELKKNPTNDDERLKALKESFVMEEKRAEIKRKYLSKFSKILTPRQLELFYSLVSMMDSQKEQPRTWKWKRTDRNSYYPMNQQKDTLLKATDIIPDKKR